MTFLIVRLLGTNAKIGEELLDVLIDNHLDYLIKNECIKENWQGIHDQIARLQENGDDNKRWSLGEIITSTPACTTLILNYNIVS